MAPWEIQHICKWLIANNGPVSHGCLYLCLHSLNRGCWLHGLLCQHHAATPCSAGRSRGIKEAWAFWLSLLESCWAAMQTKGLACWRMRDHTDQSPGPRHGKEPSQDQPTEPQLNTDTWQNSVKSSRTAWPTQTHKQNNHGYYSEPLSFGAVCYTTVLTDTTSFEETRFYTK